MRATQLAQKLVAEALTEGDVGVDATLGNGHDVLFLAERVGEKGRVHGFDVQKAALEVSAKRLRAAGFSERVSLHLRGHEEMAEVIPEEKIGAAMFNLGYLPGADKSLVTRAETTLPALEAAFFLLRRGGVLSMVCYPGHPGGGEEAEAVLRWVRALSGPDCTLLEAPEKISGERPFLVLIRKNSP